METNPLVSVCIPVYNAAEFLDDCIRSVINQSYKNIEIILVDNGSVDGSLNIAETYKSDHIIVDMEAGKGAAKARNKALNRAKGKYIQFLDADDLLSAGKIESQVLLLEKNPGKVAVCSTVHFFDSEPLSKFSPSPYEEQFLFTTDDPVEFIINLWGGNNFKASMVQPNAWLTPVDIIAKSGNWNNSLTLDDDGEFFSRVLLNSSGVIKTDGFNYYRKHKNSTANLSAYSSSIALTSAFNSILLKKEHLFSYTTSEPAQKAIYKQLKELAIKCYIKQSGLYRSIDLELKNFTQYNSLPAFGGKTINFISKNISWKLARILQLLLN